MTNLRLITTSACAAMLATTALQSTPAEARVKASGHTHASAHVTTHKGFRIAKETTAQHGSVRMRPTGRKPGSDGGTHFSTGGFPNDKPRVPLQPVPPPPPQPPTAALPTPSPAPIPPVTGPLNPGNFPGGNKTPPVISATPTPAPIPPVTGPLNPGKFPGSTGPLNPDYPGGNKPPPILTGTPTPAPIPPVTGPINPGNYPSTPPISTLPTPTPTPIPVPVPTGSSPSPNPGNGTGTSYTYQRGQFGVYADAGAYGGVYAPCLWFKSNYDRTGNDYWLMRYRVCLWRHYPG